MDWEVIESFITQAIVDGIIEVECTRCGDLIKAEPDAKEFYCEACEKLVMKNPMIEMGFM